MILIKGMSSISPLGLGVEELSARFRLDDKERLLLPPNSYNYKYLLGLSLLPKVSQYGCISVSEALRFAGYKVNDLKDNKTAVIVSSNFGNIHSIVDMFDDTDKYGPNGVNPRFFPGTVLNVLAGHISIKFKFSGPNITISEGIESGFKSLLYAYELLNKEDLKRVVICDLNIFPPPRFRSQVADYLPKFEYVSTIILEKVVKGMERTEGVPLTINTEMNLNNNHYNKVLTGPEFTPQLLAEAYRITKHGDDYPKNFGVNTETGRFHIKLN